MTHRATRQLTIGSLPRRLSDEAGEAGRDFGVGRGFMPDEDKVTLPLSKLSDSVKDVDVPVSPYAKLFGMLVGLGAAQTLPSVITGYLGNPSGKHEWIEPHWPRASARDAGHRRCWSSTARGHV